MFEDGFPFCKVVYVSFLKGIFHINWWAGFLPSTGGPASRSHLTSTNETEPSVVDVRVAGSVAIVSKELATGGLGANIGRVQVHTKHLARTPDDSDWDGLASANDFVNGRQMADGQVLTYDYFGHAWRSYRICYRPKDRNCEPVDLQSTALSALLFWHDLTAIPGQTGQSCRFCGWKLVSWSDGRIPTTTPENVGCFFLIKRDQVKKKWFIFQSCEFWGETGSCEFFLGGGLGLISDGP